MKGKKITSLLLIALFILSTLAIAIPVSLAATAEPVSIVFATDDSLVAEWINDEPVADLTPFGDYCVKAIPGATDDRIHVAVAYGKPLSTLLGLPTVTKLPANIQKLDVEFNLWPTNTATSPYAVFLLDTTGNGVVDSVVPGGLGWEQTGGTPGLIGGQWNVIYNAIDQTYQIRDYDDGVMVSSVYTGFYKDDLSTWNTGFSLAELATAAGTSTDGLADPTVLYIGYGYYNNDEPAYFDDIIIGGVTYPLEPMFLDEDYYHSDEYVTVTVIDSDESISVAATVLNDRTSQTFVINLPETSVDGIFEGNFKLVDVTPGTGELLVRDADDFKVSYGTVSITADVDDLAPTITDLAPEEKTNTTDTTPGMALTQ